MKSLVDDGTVKRVQRLVARIGVEQAQLCLGVSRQTFAQARFGGRMKLITQVRIVAVLEREEALAS